MKEQLDAILAARREAKKQPVTLEELDRRQAEMNSPAWYNSIGSMGTNKQNSLSNIEPMEIK